MTVTVRRAKRSDSRKRRLRAFLSGARKAFIIFPDARVVRIPTNSDQRSDEAALRSDWQAVGGDVRRALRKPRTEPGT